MHVVVTVAVVTDRQHDIYQSETCNGIKQP